MADLFPPEMKAVTKEQFYAALAAERKDVMPTTEYSTYTVWRERETRQAWGMSYPGWKNPGDPAAYAVLNRVRIPDGS